MKSVIDGHAFDVEVSLVAGGDPDGPVRAIVFRDGEHESSLTGPQASKFERTGSRQRLAPLVDDVKRRMGYSWVDLGGAFARYCPQPECGAILYLTSEQIAKRETGRCPNDHAVVFPEPRPVT